MRFGVCAGLEHLGLLEEAGFDYLELGIAGALRPETPEADVMPPLLAAAAGSRLRAEACNSLLPGDLKVVGDAVDLARLSRYLESGFSRARSLGVQIAVFGSGAARQIPEGFPADRAQAQLLAFLQISGEIAARHEITLAVEPLNRAECNSVNSVGEAVALAQAVAHPSVRVLSDLYHVAQEGKRYDETQEAGALLAHVHIAGREARRAPIAADFEYLVPYFAVLKRMDYTGRVSIEGNWENLAAQAAPALDVLKRAWDAA